MSTTGSTDSRSEKPMALIWGEPPRPITPPNGAEPVGGGAPPDPPPLFIGCELSGERPSYTFQPPQEWHCEQQLALRTVGAPLPF